MFQQIIALFVILYFIIKLFLEKKQNKINVNEFAFWLIFWISAGFAIIFLKHIDRIVAGLGFSSTGIDLLLYIGIIVLFSLIFKLRLKIEKQEKNITKIIREIALKK
ncbi:hypothetical protein A2331_01470 [Candidatus Falkowbacteria bacterium RIFOXYB2_FULL_34_18]|uniref:DUF2304 domain-containing protein n=1 Tax=Candidatus Falkowbacteria bacterium RIFOXYD2_FULL_34_120 TaxID=1798007 RepID=A0A1F5TPZ4_9BACT|nr:MAG: hypothetical protein A2331_01470 [Candidatus Falkowbacteria bacterium RIFOXYB2_FULL_34_18]OGF29285.1 MAG: hypothetical protein A2500_05350 [Candidatus Falkowbacteria bacterium RIFOXYC12_FULL_34_55]OGF36401.1 MAG: hypothetical protein A2466_01010 [Candidatus Falkowbacteria bacterium RIFOXYC2_FULL_34_220]OGF38880.1 MAG: hypothetical protein A2515_05770 [Candidatus Falkowbacteria bacterium RIFOXYD12_FULL_34_57]OGF40899.1 MAG: hypothetical protein A2531_03995 [Candidatus Falkowbacteria bact